MAVSFWLPKVIVVLTFCGISCAHFDDLLDRVRVSKSNDPEVRDFLRSVLRHHDDFRWIQGMLRRRGTDQLLPGLKGPSPKSKRSFYSAPHDYPEYYGYRMPPYRRPTNDVYPYEEDNEVQSARNDESFFDEDVNSKRAKRNTPEAERLLNEKLMLRNVLYNTRRSKLRRMFADTDLRKNVVNVDDKIEIFPNSEHGVLYAPGNKYEFKTDDVKKRACDDVYAGLEHANASDSSLSEFFYSTPHDILGISQDISAEQHDANTNCTKYRKNIKPARSIHLNEVFSTRRNRHAKKPNDKAIKIKIYDGGRLVKDIKRGKGANSIILTIKNDKKKDKSQQSKFMSDLNTIKNRVNQPADLLSQSDNTLQKIDAIIRHDQATLKLNNQFKQNNGWQPPAGTANNYYNFYDDPATAKRNTLNRSPFISYNQKRKLNPGDEMQSDDTKQSMDLKQSSDLKQTGDLKQSVDLKATNVSKQANLTGESLHDDPSIKIIEQDKQEKTIKHTLDYPLRGRSIKENRAAKHKYNGKIWTALSKKYSKSFAEDDDVVACSTEPQNHLEDMTEPTSAQEQRELGKINNKFSTPEMEVITTDKMMIIPFKKSTNDEQIPNDKKPNDPHEDEAKVRRKDDMGEVVDQIRKKIMEDETDENKLKSAESEDKTDVKRRNIRAEDPIKHSVAEELAANVTLSLKDSETVLDKLKVDLEKAIKSDTVPKKIRKKEPNNLDLMINNDEYEDETPSDDDNYDEPFKIETTSRKIILRDNNDEYIDLTEMPYQTRKLKSLEDSFSNVENDNHQIVKRGLTELFRMAHDEDYSEDKTDMYDKRKRTPEAPHNSFLQKLQIFKKFKKATKAPYRKMIRAKPKRGVVPRENIFLTKRQNEEQQEPAQHGSAGGGNELDIIEKTQAILLHITNAPSMQDQQQSSSGNGSTKGEYDENDDPDVKRDEDAPLNVKHMNTVRILDHYNKDDDIVGEIMKIVQKFKEKEKHKERREKERTHRLSDYDDNEEASFSHHLHKDKHTHPSMANVHACKVKSGIDHLDPYRMIQSKHQEREAEYSGPRLVREGVPDVETMEDDTSDEKEEPFLKGTSKDNPLKFTPDNVESFKEIVENSEEHKKRLKRYVDELDWLYKQAKNEDYNDELERLIAEGDKEEKVRNRRFKNYNNYDPYFYTYPRFRKAMPEPPFPPPRPVTMKRDLNETTTIMPNGTVTVTMTVANGSTTSTTIGPSTTTVNAELIKQCKPEESDEKPDSDHKNGKKKGKKKGHHKNGHKDDDSDEKGKPKGSNNETDTFNEDKLCGKSHKNDEGDETYDNRIDKKHKGKGQETEREKKLRERTREKIKQDQTEKKQAENDNLKNVLSGHTLLDLIENFHNKLKDHEKIYNRFGQAIGKKCAADQVAIIDTFRDQQTKQDIKHAQLMLHQVIVLMNKIVADQVHRKTCVVLPPTVKDFLKRMTWLRVSTSKSLKVAEGYPLPQMTGGKGENEGGNEKQNDFLFEEPDQTFKKMYPEDAMKKKILMVKKLLSKYNNMSEKCQIKVEAVKNYLVDHLNMLEKMYYGNKMNEDYCSVKPGYLAPCNTSANGSETGSTTPSGPVGVGGGNYNATTVAFATTTLATAVSSKRSSLEQMKFGKLAHHPLTPLSDKYKKLVEAADNYRRKRQIEERLARLFGRNKDNKEEEKLSTKRATKKKSPVRDLRDIAFESPQIYSLDE